MLEGMIEAMSGLKKVYFVSVLIGGPVLLYMVRYLINKTRDSRRKRLQNRKYTDSIKTSTPLDNPNKELRAAAIESIEHRFSIIRKLSGLVMLLGWIFMLIVPFLDKLPATIVSVFIASSGVVVGIAARPMIENLISGIVITFSQPFRTGDTLKIDGQYGTVEDITLTHTVIKIWNWRRYIIPNNKMLAKEFVNYTIQDSFQWTHVEFWVSYNADLEVVKQKAIEIAKSSRHFADYEDPVFWIMKMDKESVKCWVAAWAESPSKAWELECDIRMKLQRFLQDQGILSHTIVVQENSNAVGGVVGPQLMSDQETVLQ
ncbi:mechanosensitive ion channel domain-containing protein [Limibacter armeniacum]|uniref:mechanosensitive ion channel family protein n=1 Tax=Limibacter armeniacum TaxID=466084 RepID=UPI002FE5CEFE